MTNYTPCARCNEQPDSAVHLELFRNPYGHPYSDAHVTVKFRRKVIDDQSHADLSHLEQDYNDVTDLNERAKYKEQDRARLAAYNKGDWHMVGVCAEAEVKVVRPGHGTVYTLRSAGLWNIESDSDQKYFDEVYRDEINGLKQDIEAIMAGAITWETT